MRVDYAIVFVSDMSRSVAFYRDVLGLPLKFETSHWTELATEGSTLALHLADAEATPGDDPAQTPAARCRPGFSVPDLDAFHQRMLDQGVACVRPPTETFGTMIAQYLDPDGLVLGVSQQR
jgi:lactoylglutathione lyase